MNKQMNSTKVKIKEAQQAKLCNNYKNTKQKSYKKTNGMH
jgi:hypothetical protein